MIERSAATRLVDRPIFIVGPPRSGTTLLYRCLASHPDVGYFNRANRKFPHHPRLAQLVTKLRLSGDAPRESRHLWNLFDPAGKTGAHRDETDVTDAARYWYPKTIAAVLKARGATRFVAKLHAHSVRVPWVYDIFPDALFLHCLRDWRAVVKSKVVKWNEQEHEFFSVKAPGWEAVKDEPVHLIAAWSYQTVHRTLEEQTRLHPGRFHRVWYEDLCREPMVVMQRIAEFGDLRWSPDIERKLPADIRPASQRNREILTEEMIAEIRHRYGEVLAPYEYDSVTT